MRAPTGEIDTDVTGAIGDPDAGELSVLISVAGELTSHVLAAGRPLVIGRSRRCDLVVDHPSVSRHHAELAGGPLTIRDLGSTNGVRIRGERIEAGLPIGFEIGEAVQLGDALVLVQRIGDAGAGRSWRGRLLDGRVTEECARSARSGAPFAFGRVHVDPDADMAQVEDELEAALRGTDLFADAGRGQFQVLLLDTPATAARAVMHRVVTRLRTLGLGVKWSAASWPRDGTTAEQLTAHAWNALRAPGGVMERLRALIEQIADSTTSVLIRGETGVGKELCAETIHRLSGRARAPFVRINCAALSEALPGLIESADGGTVFLDEVGDLPRPLQAKLLRVLEDRVVQRVGAIEGRAVDVRFLSATNRSLEADIAAGAFRRDLYFRLGGVTIELPPLRDRPEELDGLIAAFVTRASGLANRPEPELTDDAMAALHGHTWPGNVRELRDTIERAVLLCGGGPLDVEHVALGDLERSIERTLTTGPIEKLAADPPPLTDERLRDEVARLEERRITDALVACAGNQTRAARMLGIARNTLQARLDAFGIPRPRKGR